MRVLVTGATGFLGKYVVEAFAKQNYDVIAFGRNEAAGRNLEAQNIKFINGDFTDREQILQATKDVDIVIHAGALSTVWGKWSAFYNANVLGTQNVVSACLENGVGRLVFVSSPSIYSSKHDRFNIEESDFDPTNDLNYYIKSKILAEKIIREANAKGLYTVIIRPRGLFGVGDTSIFPRLIAANSKAGVPLINGGENIIDVTYVENVALALWLAATVENINGEVFNITNGEPIKFKDILDEIFDKIGVKPKFLRLNFKAAYGIAIVLESLYRILPLRGEPLLTKYIACTLATSQTLDISNAREKLGYKPQYSITEGIDIYVNRRKNSN
ncbi:MAG: SDR family NAD(P)-dependent oxidoreductase [Campylobacteraceae bacterium]|jgi:nucleoside-diphosphate-sugar epimerase|nr:SDR family NAD(P)-dependent oxidoreductase [Campylobacteraceae bacterium]